VNVTVPLVVAPVRVTVFKVPPPVQEAPSPPLAVVLVCAQLSVTVPVYPATALTVTVAVAVAPGAMPEELAVEGL
jgi:hypothetical protein